MSVNDPDSRFPPPDHPDRLRWEARYGAGFVPSFTPRPLAIRALALDLPDGPVADLACGAAGTALLAAAAGRQVTAVDISELALGLLGAEARRRGLEHLVTLVHADLARWRPPPGSHALVLCTGWWERAVFGVAAAAVAPGGLLGWEALTAEARRARPGLSPDWCLGPAEPAALLPAGFTAADQHDVPGHHGLMRRQLLARRTPPRQ
jgi:SAM-dependent methyltransferase